MFRGQTFLIPAFDCGSFLCDRFVTATSDPKFFTHFLIQSDLKHLFVMVLEKFVMVFVSILEFSTGMFLNYLIDF